MVSTTPDHSSPVVATALVCCIFLVAACLIYRVSSLHPLANVPGPFYVRLTSLWLNYHAWIGDECTAVHQLHDRYGPIVCTGPNSVDIADGDAISPIYQERGGFLKPEFYLNFNIDGHQTIFSATNPAHRAPRAKAVIPLFSTSSLRAGKALLRDAALGFIGRLKRDAESAGAEHKTLDILPVCRGFALDSVSSYLFRVKYGACQEDMEKPVMNKKVGKLSEAAPMSAERMVDAFVAVGKNWYFSPWEFQWLESIEAFLWPDQEATDSIAQVDEFVARVAVKASAGDLPGAFPSRLLASDFSDDEVRAQCKDLIFAGTDSTAMNLATICFNLAKSPEKYDALKREMDQVDLDADVNLQALPYLQAVIKEGLRLSMANPSRLPRVVPEGGFRFKNSFIPSGTVVSCTPFELHFNPAVYSNPRDFVPERWLVEQEPTDAMKRDFMAFGHGPRQCIAKNLAMAELTEAVSMIAAHDALAGLENVGEEILMKEWFNSHVTDGKIELQVIGQLAA